MSEGVQADASEAQPFQYAPEPTILIDLAKRHRIEPGWSWSVLYIERDEDFGRGTAGGWTLIIHAVVQDTYHPDRHFPLNHYFPVPGATYNEKSWRRWLFECYAKVRFHECMENFVEDDGTEQGFRPYAPLHGPGDDPYVLHEMATDEQRRTQFTGGMDHGFARPEGWTG